MAGRSDGPTDTEFPCSLVISVPLPTHRLALSALRALQVDAELSPLVRRSFSLTNPAQTSFTPRTNGSDTLHLAEGHVEEYEESDRVDPINQDRTILHTEYKATTNRMLRVAVNGFMESLGVVLGVMEELDVDVLTEPE